MRSWKAHCASRSAFLNAKLSKSSLMRPLLCLSIFGSWTFLTTLWLLIFSKPRFLFTLSCCRKLAHAILRAFSEAPECSLSHMMDMKIAG